MDATQHVHQFQIPDMGAGFHQMDPVDPLANQEDLNPAVALSGQVGS